MVRFIEDSGDLPVADPRLVHLQVLKLLQCVRNEDIQQIEKLTLNGIPDLINYSEPENGETALHLAACKNNETMIKLLLDLGANANVVDLKGRSPAMRAAEYGHVQALKLLTEAHSDMTVRDAEGKGILFYCIEKTQRHLECLKICLKHGANANNVSKDGRPLLAVAAEPGHVEILSTLLVAGATPDSKNKKTGETALHYAATSGSLGCVRALLEAGADFNILDSENVHSAHRAAKNGHFEVIRTLAGYGADLGRVSNDGNTPIHLAAEQGHGPICKFLAQRGCPATLKNKEGKVPKVLAKENEHKEAMKECRKAEKRKTGKPGTEPWAVRLYDWVQEHETKVLDMFLQFDAPTEEEESTGKVTKENFITCLQTLNVPIEVEFITKIANLHDPNREDSIDYKVFLSGKKFVNKQYMVTAGKKKKKKGGKKGKKKKGKTKIPIPICTAPEGPRTKKGGPPAEFVERYVHFTDNTRFDRDRPPSHPIQDDSSWYLTSPDPGYVNISDAAKLGDVETIKTALLRGTEVDQRDKYYKTPLMSACLHGNIMMAKYLLAAGADINAKDNFNWTPLHHACHSGQTDLVELLVEKGADIDSLTFNGGTPLMRAIESSREGVVEYLIGKSAKVQVENKKGHTALDIAKAYADPRIVAIVQKRWDEIPPPVDKKKRGGKSAKRGTKSAPPKKTHMPSIKTPPEAEQVQTNEEDEAPPRKSSVLRAASVLGVIADKPRSIAYTPTKAWIPQPTTEDLLRERETRRLRFSYEIDFPEFLPPFQKHVSTRSKELEAIMGDD